MYKHIFTILAVLISGISMLMTSCKKDKPEPILVAMSLELVLGDNQEVEVESPLSEFERGEFHSSPHTARSAGEPELAEGRVLRAFSFGSFSFT